jgi:adenylate cyclase
MDGPPDPADTTFQRLLNREILLSERRRMRILAALQAFILVLILLAATFVPGFVRSIYHDRVRAALAAFSAFVAYELFAAGLLTIFIRRGRNFPVFGRYVNAFVETSFPTVLLYLLAGYLFAPAVFGTWTALLYFLFIILSTLRLDFKLSAFTGAVGAVELFALAMVILHLEWRSEDPDFSIGYHLTRSARPSRRRPAGRLRRSDDQEPFPAGARRRLGPRRSDQSLRSTRLAASGRAAHRNRRRRTQRNEAGLRHVR